MYLLYIYILVRRNISFHFNACKKFFIIIKICFLSIIYNYGNAYPINQKRINPHTSEERTSDTQSESSLDLFRIELKSILLLKSLDKELQDEKKYFLQVNLTLLGYIDLHKNYLKYV